MKRPPELCCWNCFKAWSAARPRPELLYCWHAGALAEPDGEGWKVTPKVGPLTLKRLRLEGKL